MKGQILLPIPMATFHFFPPNQRLWTQAQFFPSLGAMLASCLRGASLADMTREAATGHPFSLEFNCPQSQGECHSAD